MSSPSVPYKQNLAIHIAIDSTASSKEFIVSLPCQAPMPAVLTLLENLRFYLKEG